MLASLFYIQRECNDYVKKAKVSKLVLLIFRQRTCFALSAAMTTIQTKHDRARYSSSEYYEQKLKQ